MGNKPKSSMKALRHFLCQLLIFTVIISLLLIVLVLTRADCRRRCSLNLELENEAKTIFQSRMQYTRAAVASDNGVCSEIGRDIMVAGGNAVDAAIATTACESVMNPHSAGFGGGHFASIYLRDQQRCITINAREVAPQSTHMNTFDGNEKLAFKGYKSIAVPGEVHGLYSAYKLYASKNITWYDLLAPTIKLARNGHFLSTTVATALRYDKHCLDMAKQGGKCLAPYKNETGHYYEAGAVIKRPLYADFLEMLANASDPIYEFYKSDDDNSIAQTIVRELKANGAYITADDLAKYESVISETELYNLGDNLHACAIGLPSGNPITLGLIRVMAEYNVKKSNSIDDWVNFWHKFNDASRFFYAARQALGDPDFVPTARKISNLMINGTMTKQIRDAFDPKSTHVNIDDYYLYNKREFLPDDKGTTHISIVDDHGIGVSLTSTINSYFGAKVGSDQLGFFWNNEMDDFALPFAKNQFGIQPSKANFIEPGKRPLSSMSPSIIVDNNGLVRLVMGAAGGTRIITGTAIIGIRTLLLNETIDEAIIAPRMHDQLSPNRTLYESFTNEEIISKLKDIGYNMTAYEGRMSVVTGVQQAPTSINDNVADYNRIRWLAASDPRKGSMSYPAGF